MDQCCYSGLDIPILVWCLLLLVIFLGDYYVKMDLHISVAAEQQKDLCGHPLLHSYFGIPQTA